MSEAGNELDELLDEFVQSLVRDVEGLPEAPAPFGAVRLTPEEQLARYASVREDPAFWAQALAERGLDETLRYARTMERRLGDAGTDSDTNAGQSV